MGNEPICSRDTRDLRSSTYVMCGKQQQLRNSTSINIVNYVPIVTGPPLNFQKQETFKKVEKSASQFCFKNGLDNMYIPLVARIIAYGHKNIFIAYSRLPEHSKQQFLEEIKFADVDFLDSLYHKFILGEKKARKLITPPPRLVQKQKISEVHAKRYIEVGNEMLAKSQVAFLFLCAGSSSRFMFQQKFLCPLELNPQKSLLELMLHRLRKNITTRDNQVVNVPIIIACNEYNRVIIQNFIKSKSYCGFQPSRIRYLTIPNLPVLDSKGKLCLTFEFKIINRPSGTGRCIEQFLGSGLFNLLKNSNINTMHIVGCENLMQNPGDPYLLGMMKVNSLDMVSKCTDPIFPGEEFSRYSGADDGKIYLANTEQIANCSERMMEACMESCPIAMNSIVCGLSELKNMTRQYQNSMFLSLEYTANKKTQNYYDFEKNRPLVGASMYVFQKQMGHLLSCTKNNAILKVPRSEYLPIVTKNSSYSLREACKKLAQRQQTSINNSRVYYQ